MLYSTYYINRYTRSSLVLEGPNMDFVTWINNVERIILEYTGYNLLDIPDEPYMINFESGLTIDDMVSIIMESNGFVRVKKSRRKQKP